MSRAENHRPVPIPINDLSTSQQLRNAYELQIQQSSLIQIQRNSKNGKYADLLWGRFKITQINYYGIVDIGFKDRIEDDTTHIERNCKDPDLYQNYLNVNGTIMDWRIIRRNEILFLT